MIDEAAGLSAERRIPRVGNCFDRRRWKPAELHAALKTSSWLVPRARLLRRKADP